MLYRLLLALLAAAAASPLRAREFTFGSGPGKAHLLELYTSEGCSSCPPAEAWLNALQGSPALWNSIIPVNFHVTYWDYLGWKDPFARPEYNQRQRDFAAQWQAATVYTPEFVLDGAEWHPGTLPHAGPALPGGLSATLTSASLRVAYAPRSAPELPRVAFYVLLHAPVTINVKAGENRGRRLLHHFLAGSSGRLPLGSGPKQHGAVQLPAADLANAAGLVVWVARGGELAPEQAAGTALGAAAASPPSN